MRTIILAGGFGTRLSEETDLTPKPMVEIGGMPILLHIMHLYGAQGFREFVVALGYKGERIKEFFLRFRELHSDLTVDVASGRVEAVSTVPLPDWRVHLVDTGPTTDTGGRLKRLAGWLSDEDTFMMTYGDGLADVDLKALVAFHRAHGRLATVTAVRPPGRFGAIELDGDRVRRFAEKPQAGEGWINGGFMVLDRRVLDYIPGDDTVFEVGPMERLAADGQLMAWKHAGFFQPMDTLREKRLLEGLWTSGRAPWKVG